MKYLMKIVLLAASLFGAAEVSATRIVVDFEGLPSTTLDDGYGGLSGWYGQVATHYFDFITPPPEVGDYGFQGSGTLSFNRAPVIFEGMFYNYWGDDTAVSYSLYYKGQLVFSQLLDAINQPRDIYWLASGYAGLIDKIQFHGLNTHVIDNLTYSTTTTVPLPGSIFLIGTGLLGLLIQRHKYLS